MNFHRKFFLYQSPMLMSLPANVIAIKIRHQKILQNIEITNFSYTMKEPEIFIVSQWRYENVKNNMCDISIEPHSLNIEKKINIIFISTYNK